MRHLTPTARRGKGPGSDRRKGASLRQLVVLARDPRPGVSFKPSDFIIRPDWVGRLRKVQYGTSAPRNEPKTFYNFPEHLHRWLKVFANEAGRTLQEAACFSIEEGCRMLLSLPTPDAIERTRAVIEKDGTPLQYRGVKSLAFSVTRPHGYEDLKKVTVRLTLTAIKDLTAIETKLGMTCAPLAILLVLVDVPALPTEAREQLYQDAKRLVGYLETTAAEMGALAKGVCPQPTGSERSMGDLLKTPDQPLTNAERQARFRARKTRSVTAEGIGAVTERYGHRYGASKKSP